MNQKLSSKFIVLKKLGKGTFSNVYKVQKISNKKFYALKRIVVKKLNQKELNSALNEIRILASFQSPYLIGYKEAFIDKESQDLCIIMDYCNGGDLKCQIRKMSEKKERFSEKKIIKFFFQLTSALEILHKNSIVHRDIKSANVMIDKKLKNVKIGDMNVSTIVKSMFAYTQTGTPFYASPEVWREDPYNCKADVWSLGCLLFELCMHRTPFQAENINVLNDKIQNRKMENFDNFYSKELQHCILKLLSVNQHLRPTTEEILKFKIFDKFEKKFCPDISLLDTIRSNSNFLSIGYDFPESQYSDVEANNDKEFVINFKKQSVKKQKSKNKKLRSNTSLYKIIQKKKTESTKESLEDINANQKYQKILNIGVLRKTKNYKSQNYLSQILPKHTPRNNLVQKIDNIKNKVMNNSQKIHSILQSNYQHRCTSQKLILKQKFLNSKNSQKNLQSQLNSRISFLNYDVQNQSTNFSRQRSLQKKNLNSYRYSNRNNQQYITYDQRNQMTLQKEQKEKIDLIKKLISQKNIQMKRKCSNQNLNSKKVKDLVQFLKKN